MRGDHVRSAARASCSGGLPPRARGSHVDEASELFGNGPTPACAGITKKAASALQGFGAYPRVRGDHTVEQVDGAVELGLPPRARGSPVVAGLVAPGAGPTPACAGITAGRRHQGAAGEAYPRVRGDHHVYPMNSNSATGLPPRARGSPERGNPVRTCSGPTPACAGITPHGLEAVDGLTAYPRVRGDHLPKVLRVATVMGLPPRARGSPRRDRRKQPHRGPTPACAGITRRSGRTRHS